VQPLSALLFLYRGQPFLVHLAFADTFFASLYLLHPSIDTAGSVTGTHAYFVL
jgi:hypothetical protein